MELKELKCPNCKATMTIDAKDSKVTCQYCGTTFQVDDMEERNQDFQRTVEETILRNMKSTEKIGKIITIIVIIIFMLVFGFISYLMVSDFIEMKKDRQEFDKNYNEIKEKIEDEYEKIEGNTPTQTETEDNKPSQFEIDSFNRDYELYEGKSASVFVKQLLNKIITNNKKNPDKLITVIYNEQQTTNPTEIENIRDNLEEWGNYSTSLDYNEEGFVYKLTMKKLG